MDTASKQFCLPIARDQLDAAFQAMLAEGPKAAVQLQSSYLGLARAAGDKRRYQRLT